MTVDIEAVWRFPKRDMNKHLWAFWYFCRRKGDRCYTTRDEVIIERRSP